MIKTFLLIVAGATLITGTISADKIEFKNPVRSAAEDEVTQLPGWSGANFKHYSGYLEADDLKPTNRFLHYWFVESQSNPAEDPLVLWLNGGPGCSSLLGLLTELGPFRVDSDGTVTENKYAWNKRANVIFLESPIGVGFSYPVDGQVYSDDDSTAEQNHLALKSFLRKFPHYKNNSLYLTGESYAGVYLPTLAVRVDKDPEMNLKGVAIGNGLLESTKTFQSMIFFGYYHGLVGKSTWSNLSTHCCDGKEPALDRCQFAHEDVDDECLLALWATFDSLLNSGVNPYNLYDKCYGAVGSESRSREHVDKSLILHAFNATRRSSAINKFHRFAYGLPESHIKFSLDQRVTVQPPCTDSSASVNYLNRRDVQEALHIPNGLDPFDGCAEVDYTVIYPDKPGGLAPQMRQLIESPRKPTLLVYNGDIDLICNVVGDEWFVDDLQREVVQDYTPWYVDNQVAGFAKYFDRITFMTVKGSGHLVPADKPAQAERMFDMFLEGMKPPTETDRAKH